MSRSVHLLANVVVSLLFLLLSWSVSYARTPFGGTPWAVPGRIEIENFDEGAEQETFHDTTSFNEGDASYRSSPVDIGSYDNGQRFYVGWVVAGEWLEYTVNVANSGLYNVEMSYASIRGCGGAMMHIEVDGVDKSGSLTLPGTSNTWLDARGISATGISMGSGLHVLRLSFDANGPCDNVGNFFEMFIRSSSQAPYSERGNQISVLGHPRIEAEYFDVGGENVAFHETTPGNQGGDSFRTVDAGQSFPLGVESVDIARKPNDSGVGSSYVGWTAPSEWLEYTVQIDVAGFYDFTLAYAMNTGCGNGASVHFEVDGSDQTGSIPLPDTGGWEIWQTTAPRRVLLQPGRHVLRLSFDNAGACGNVGNIDYLAVTPAGDDRPIQSAFRFNAIPGLIQTEDFDNGGEGIAYHDTTSTNEGNNQAYRGEAVDLFDTQDNGVNNIAVGWVRAGEWLEYTTSVGETGNYTVEIRYSVLGDGAAMHIEFLGVDKTGRIDLPSTGSWENFQTVTRTIQLDKGSPQIMRVVFDAEAPSTGSVGNFNYIRFTNQ